VPDSENVPTPPPAGATMLSPLPLFHSYALNLSVLAVLATGASEYIM